MYAIARNAIGRPSVRHTSVS